ncbi:MAG TPA: four-carbon acid sugar kinase family protein [Verrucomicrobiae bacterium]
MIGVIADDLTGAAELGAIGWRHGLRAEIVRSGKPGRSADLVCVDTDSRARDPQEAGRRAAAAARLLQAAGARWIYKKVDSVLRGQVTAEVEAVMKQLKLDRALLLPANPTLGRIIRGGEYFLRGRPLHKTEFAHDPHFPRRSSQVLRLVKVPETFKMHVANGERLLPAATILVGNAESTADLQSWTAACDPAMLPAGGAEFFNALLDREEGGESAPAPAVRGRAAAGKLTVRREFFIVGTSTQAARHFVATERRRKTPVFALPQELAWGATFSEAATEAIAQRIIAGFEISPRVVLNVGLPQVRDKDVAARLSGHVVRLAERVLQKFRVNNVFAEGGATAAELVRCMDWPRLEIVRELAPGVATLAVDGDPDFLLTIKPGSYSWPAKWT